MRRFLLLFLGLILLNTQSWAESDRVTQLKTALKNFTDCQTLVHLYDPSAIESTHLGLCVYEWVETRGIYADRACVVSMIEPETQTRDPFYKKNGHWGVMGHCTKQKLEQLLTKKDTYTTVNPVTSVQEKHTRGWQVELLRDELNVWPVMGPILQKPTPTFPKNPKVTQ